MTGAQCDAPIVIVFRGWEPYLELAVLQIQSICAGAEIIVIGGNTRLVRKGVRVVGLMEHEDSARKLRESYVHLSTHSVEFERFCIERWFILLDFMKQEGLERCIHLDGDVMLWCDQSEFKRLYGRYGLTWVGPGSPGIVTINDRGHLESLCEFLVSQYTNETNLGRLKAMFAGHVASGKKGGVCDMHLLKMFRQESREPIGDSSQIRDGMRMDGNIISSEGYEMYLGMKRIEWLHGRPYATQIGTGVKVRMGMLHFGGPVKAYMRLFDGKHHYSHITRFMSFPSWCRYRYPAVKRRLVDRVRRIGLWARGQE